MSVVTQGSARRVVVPAGIAVFCLAFAYASAKPPTGFDGPELATADDRKMAMLAERYLDGALQLDPVQAS